MALSEILGPVETKLLSGVNLSSKSIKMKIEKKTREEIISRFFRLRFQDFSSRKVLSFTNTNL
jgi:hypothetical protein